MSLPRNIGRFMGHIVKAVRSDTAAGRTTVRVESREARIDTPQGPATLRRTVIDEIENDTTDNATNPPEHA